MKTPEQWQKELPVQGEDTPFALPLHWIKKIQEDATHELRSQLADQIAELEKSDANNNILQRLYNEERAKCAEMRGAFRMAREMICDAREQAAMASSVGVSECSSLQWIWSADTRKAIDKCLSSDCGKGWVPPELSKALVDALEKANLTIHFIAHECDFENSGEELRASRAANPALNVIEQALARAKEFGLE